MSRTLAIDIGGTGIKATVLGASGKMLVERVRVATPYPCTPRVLVTTVTALIAPLPRFDRIAVGFPGVVRDGTIITAPHFGNNRWHGFDLAGTLEQTLGKPVRVINDAELQGLAAISGVGLELVVTLGTGMGTALFRNGELMPHMELAQHPAHHDKTYNEWVGDKARRKIGKQRWNRRVQRALRQLYTLLNYDHVFVGGGNSRHVASKLGTQLTLISNEDGLLGGFALWRPRGRTGPRIAP